MVDSPAGAPNKTTSSGSGNRIIAGLVMGAVAMTLIALGGWIWVAAAFAMCLLGFLELEHLMRAKAIHPSRAIVLIVSVSLFLAAALHKTHWFLYIITLGILLSFFRLLFRTERAGISDIAATILAFFYIAFFPVHFILLRDLDQGLGYTLMTAVVLSMSDVGAYFAGKAFGRHPLYPAISPKKTREGALLGTLIGVGCGVIAAWFIGFPLEHAVILGFLLSIVGQLGDLSESLLKRDAGMKDSGALLQSHGGMLDRMDSFIFSGAVAYYYIYWFVLQKGFGRELLDWVKTIHG